MNHLAAALLSFPVASSIPFAAMWYQSPPTGDSLNLSLVLFGIVIYLMVTLVTVTLGLPMYLVLRRFALVNWWASCAAGALVGALIGLTFGRSGVDTASIDTMVPAGCVSGLFFWISWRALTGRSQCASDPQFP